MFLMWHSADVEKRKKACLGLIGMFKEISPVAIEIKANICCEICFHDMMSVP